MSEQDIERRIVTGLIVSEEYIRKIKPFWRDDLLGSPELRRVARWCLEHFERYAKVPDRDIEGIFFSALQTESIPKADAEFIELILTRVSDEYGRAQQFNSAYLLDQTVKYARERRLADGMDDAGGWLDRGEVDAAAKALAGALKPIPSGDATDTTREAADTMREAAANVIEATIDGDLSRARIAAWKIATVVSPADRLPDPWGELEPPGFDLEMLPSVLRHFAEVRSRSIGIEPSALAWSTIAACSGTLDGSLRLQMKRNDPGFAVPPGIWLLLVGDPSSRKTPVLKAAFAPLSKLQAERIARWQEERKDQDPDGPAPTLVQLLTHDSTQEGLRDLLASQDRGVITFNDEWSRHIGAMGRYSGGRDAGAADRAFYNVAFDGGPWVSNRAARRGGSERIVVKNLQVMVVGGVQPDVLRQFNRGGGLLVDGMLQRSCTILMGKTRLGTDIDPIGETQRYEWLIRRLARVPGDRVLHLTEAAEAVRARVEERLFPHEQMDAFGPGFATAAGKLHGIWGRIALTLAHVLSPRTPPEVVGEDAALMAERLVFESLLPNMARFYQALGGGGDDIETTRAIAAFLLRQQRVRVTASEVVQHVHAVHGHKADQVRDAVSPLVSMGWLTPEGDDERRARAWEVNHAIYSQFSERAGQARAQAALAREALAHAFGAKTGVKTGGDGRDEEPSGGDGTKSAKARFTFRGKVLANALRQSARRDEWHGE
jgi:hypothetical protein